MSGAVDSGQLTEDSESGRVDAETAMHFLRSRLNEQPTYKRLLSNGHRRLVPWERLEKEEQEAQLQAMQDLLDWLSAPGADL